MEGFHRHLQSHFDEIVENVIWFMTNLTQDSFLFRDQMVNSKVFGEIQKILRKSSLPIDLIRQCINLVHIINKLSDTIPSKRTQLECLEIFSNYIQISDQEVMCLCIWGIYYISSLEKLTEKNPDSIIKVILDSGAIVKILRIPFDKYRLCAIPSIRLLGNMCACSNTIVNVNKVNKNLGIIRFEDFRMLRQITGNLF